MSSSHEPSEQLEARLLQLTDEIEQMRVDLGRKIDEAAALMARISARDATSSRHPSVPPIVP
jgi:vacuolar-type H+-ATPase subunit D/Vma8